MTTTHIIEADLTWTGAAFERSVQVEVSADGRIGRTGPLGLRPTHRLERRALLPGMVNSHSHAFQRGLRGRGETFPNGEGSFWTWRQAMYGLVERMDIETLHALSLAAFREMLSAGITTVGEFHYLHHDSTCEGFAFDEVVLGAAADAGIRIALLNTYYNTGAIGEPLSKPQRRFRVTSPDVYWARMDRLASVLQPRLQTLGAVAHSVRAANIQDIIALHEESRRRGLVFHMHVEEQRREIEECAQAYGSSPMALLNDRLSIDERFTAVHCTHTDPLEMERFAASGGNVCVCPITEANLGDGLADVPGMLDSEANLCIGTDSNSRLSMAEEMRWLEYVQRLGGERRGVVVDEQGSAAGALWRMATVNGARSLGVEAGEIQTGMWADFVSLDLDHASLSGWTPETLLDSFVFGASDHAINGRCVGGRWV